MKTLLPILLLIELGCASQQTKRGGPDPMAEKLNNGIPILIEKQVFEKDLELLSMLDPVPVGKGLYQASTRSAITFQDCTFKGTLSAFAKKGEQRTDLMSFGNSVSFLNCHFEKEVNLRGATFQGRTDFSGSVFEEKAIFEGASFMQGAWFNSCLFRGEARFHQVFFHERANFMEAQFSKTASFQQASFNSEGQFSVTKFAGYADFSLISTRAPFFFNYAEFSGKADFTDASFGHDLHFAKTRIGTVTFEQARFMGRIHPSGFLRDNPPEGEGMFFLMEEYVPPKNPTDR